MDDDMLARCQWLTIATIVIALLPSAPAAAPPQPAAGTVARFAFDANPIALTGPARPSRYMEASGRRAAFLGREDGSFEAWAYPLKILHGFNLAFGIAAYADPIPAADLAATVAAKRMRMGCATPSPTAIASR